MYGDRYIIPNWDAKGNHQMFYRQCNGTWMDTYNEVERSQEWIEEHIAPYFKKAPNDVSLVEYLVADKSS